MLDDILVVFEDPETDPLVLKFMEYAAGLLGTELMLGHIMDVDEDACDPLTGELKPKPADWDPFAGAQATVAFPIHLFPVATGRERRRSRLLARRLLMWLRQRQKKYPASTIKVQPGLMEEEVRSLPEMTSWAWVRMVRCLESPRPELYRGTVGSR